MKRLSIYFCTVTTLASGAAAFANDSPTGLWQSIDDASGKPRAEIRITEEPSGLTGRIVRNLLASDPAVVQLCTKCTDDRLGKPMIGMEMIRRAKRVGGSPVWEGGEILDPDKGQTYRLQLTLAGGGQHLQVRGYIGLFFRTQVWRRVG